MFVAIVEKFLSEESLLKLRAMLFPSVLIDLGHLSAADSVRFFEQTCKVNKFYLTPARIRHLADLTGGYPLMMVEHVKKTCKKIH